MKKYEWMSALGHKPTTLPLSRCTLELHRLTRSEISFSGSSHAAQHARLRLLRLTKILHTSLLQELTKVLFLSVVQTTGELA